MPSTFPCPNPTCSHAFNAESVQGVSSLACPRCGTKLDFRAQAAAPARPAAPPKAAAPPKPPAAPPKAAAAPVKVAAPPVKVAAPAKPTAPPLAKPVAAKPAKAVPPPLPPSAIRPAGSPPLAAPAVPMATPVTAAPTAPSALAFQSQSDLMVTPPRRRRTLPGWLIATLLVGGVFGGMAVLILGYIFYIASAPLPGEATGLGPEDKHGFIQGVNFHVNLPVKPWQQDKTLQTVLKVSLAYSRSGPSSSMALLYRDYQTRQPRDAEMIDEALNRIKTYLDNAEYEVKPKDDKSKLGGQSAVLLEFQGEDPQHVQVGGECLAMTYHGVAYWLFTWAPVDDGPAVAGEWEALRHGFTLGDQREGWKEIPPKTATIQGDRAPYKLDYIESVWQKQERDGYDPRADAVLLGYDPKDKDARRGDMSATVQVLALEKAPDLDAAVKEAKDAALEIEKEKQTGAEAYSFPGAVLNVVTDKSLPNADNNADVGAFRGHISKFEAKKSADHSKYVVLAVVKMDDVVLAVVCESAWERRDYWEQEFTPLLDKLRKK